ncbi:hypothetical protein ABZ173_38770 [Streptomyces rochei]
MLALVAYALVVARERLLRAEENAGEPGGGFAVERGGDGAPFPAAGLIAR